MMANRGPSLFKKLLWSKSAVAAFIVLGLLIGVALAAPIIAPQNSLDPAQWDLYSSLAPPAFVGGDDDTGDSFYLLGTDDQGRDLLSAIMFGLRISLFVGFSVVILSSIIGTSLGIVAGYMGGKIETLIMRAADIWLSFPSILIALFILSVSGRGLSKLIFAIVVVRWVAYARTARGCTLAEKEKDYISAARALGQSTPKIMFNHILPNVLSPLAVIAGVEVAMVIILEATLSFLGVGTEITKPSLGMLIKNGYEDLLSGNWWITVFPGLTLVALVFSINILVDWLRDTLNPHLAATAGAEQMAE